MDLNTIKKELYKQKPIAYRHGNTKGGNLLYVSFINISDTHREELKFSIPKIEAEGFEDEISAQLLIRWIKL